MLQTGNVGLEIKLKSTNGPIDVSLFSDNGQGMDKDFSQLVPYTADGQKEWVIFNFI